MGVRSMSRIRVEGVWDAAYITGADWKTYWNCAGNNWKSHITGADWKTYWNCAGADWKTYWNCAGKKIVSSNLHIPFLI